MRILRRTVAVVTFIPRFALPLLLRLLPLPLLLRLWWRVSSIGADRRGGIQGNRRNAADAIEQIIRSYGSQPRLRAFYSSPDHSNFSRCS